ncbi:hypothetical protein [Thermococcus sp. 9N3]|uniref:hypothetical protein n=1 Tax=Thermococcus sp. 9N3 TaxID=163002 RepID=UPI00142F7186|nr:hypothetical protein [Thermococcus sp. 9N3]NJE48512.1 hypothetical protein [Thermococcus sp. 9N3]
MTIKEYGHEQQALLDKIQVEIEKLQIQRELIGVGWVELFVAVVLSVMFMTTPILLNIGVSTGVAKISDVNLTFSENQHLKTLSNKTISVNTVILHYTVPNVNKVNLLLTYFSGVLIFMLVLFALSFYIDAKQKNTTYWPMIIAFRNALITIIFIFILSLLVALIMLETETQTVNDETVRIIRKLLALTFTFYLFGFLFLFSVTWTINPRKQMKHTANSQAKLSKGNVIIVLLFSSALVAFAISPHMIAVGDKMSQNIQLLFRISVGLFGMLTFISAITLSDISVYGCNISRKLQKIVIREEILSHILIKCLMIIFIIMIIITIYYAMSITGIISGFLVVLLYSAILGVLARFYNTDEIARDLSRRILELNRLKKLLIYSEHSFDKIQKEFEEIRIKPLPKKLKLGEWEIGFYVFDNS